MSSTVLIDGRLALPEQAQVSVFDRGFLYGDSVFESFRTYGGVPFALNEHLARLLRSAERVQIACALSLEELRREVLSAIALQGGPECYVRLMLTRGIGRSLGLDPELAEHPLRVVIVTPLSLPPAASYERGIAAIIYRAERASDACGAAAAKTGNYLLAVLAARAARERGASEALIEDAHGQILEGATSNLFAVIGGRLVTAPESCAILPGITRGEVLSLARAADLPLEFRALSRLELQAAEEVFVCSSLRELVPVVTLDGHPIGSGLPGPMTRELLARYRALATR